VGDPDHAFSQAKRKKHFRRARDEGANAHPTTLATAA
jgi:hypothetical protein